MLRTVAALPGAATREIRAWDGVATSCVDRRATDAPVAAPLTGRLLGTFQTRFDGREVVVRHLGYFVFMQKQIRIAQRFKQGRPGQ